MQLRATEYFEGKDHQRFFIQSTCSKGHRFGVRAVSQGFVQSNIKYFQGCCPTLEGFKAKLDGALSGLVWWEVSLLMAGVWSWEIFKVPLKIP